MNVLVVFDDTNEKSEIIRDVIGGKGFADVVVKRKRLEIWYQEKINRLFPQAQWRLLHSVFEFHELQKGLEAFSDAGTRVLHCFSNYMISDEEKAMLSFEKLCYIDESYQVMTGGRPAAVMFADLAAYGDFLKLVCGGLASADAAKQIMESFTVEGLVDIGMVGNFIQCIAGNFDSRYFNSLRGDAYTIVKSSVNKEKIRSEYNYYHLLPEDMKFWYVMPFCYQEEKEAASYTMERLHMTNLAVKWVHGSIDAAEFEQLMDKYFYFFRSRHCRKVTHEVYQRTADILYVDKVVRRIADFKRLPEYSSIAALMAAGCRERSIDVLMEKYFRLKAQVDAENDYPQVSVIGHGDPCFANAMYNKATETLKFIDPKGALTEAELWTDPYYDVAKLSHSVCGRYDFFNNALFDIRIDEALSCKLDIPFDNTSYVRIFRRKLEENGYDYQTVRLYEASLFLSMLPLHMDYPQKVFAFILNASDILEEIENDV